MSRLLRNCNSRNSTDTGRKPTTGKRKSDQNFQKLVNTYRQFKVKPDKNIRFEKKKALYHKPAYGKLIIRISAAAAIVMLMISMGRFLIHPRPDQETVLPIAGNAVKIEPAEIIRHTPAPLPVKQLSYRSGSGQYPLLFISKKKPSIPSLYRLPY